MMTATMSATTEINDRTFAAYMVIEEHNRLAEALMATVGMLDGFQREPGGLPQLNVENLRKATARMMF